MALWITCHLANRRPFTDEGNYHQKRASLDFFKKQKEDKKEKIKRLLSKSKFSH